MVARRFAAVCWEEKPSTASGGCYQLPRALDTSRLLAAVFIRRQFCVKCDANELVLPSGWSSRLGCRELEGLCEKQSSHPGWGGRGPAVAAQCCAGGPPSGSSSVPRAPCLEVACSKAREWEGSAAFCLLYAVLTIFACSLVVAAYKCEVRRVHCSYSKWQQLSSAPVSSIDNGNTLACRTNKHSFSKQLNKTLVTSWVFVVSALNDICPRSGFEQNCFSMNGMKKSPNRAFVQLHTCIINVFYVVCFDLSLRAECWNDQRPGAIWEGFQLCCT